MIFGTSAGADTGNASGKGPALFAGADGSSNIKRSELEFNIASANIPAGATITGVTIATDSWTSGRAQGGNGGSITFGWVTSSACSMSQSGVGPTDQCGRFNRRRRRRHGPRLPAGDSDLGRCHLEQQATLLVAINATSDGLDYCLGRELDFKLDGYCRRQQQRLARKSVKWTSTTAMVADVQGLADGNPSDNNGWILKNSDETDATDFLAFWSAQGAAASNNSALAPGLTITYTPVPEPSAVLLLAGALPMLLWRRRRDGKEQIA